MINNFYVYILLDPRKPGVYEYGEYKFDYEPFYVGKGKDNRYHEHLRENSLKKNSYKNNKIKIIISEKLEPITIKVKENLLECQSFKFEIDLIKIIGRFDLGDGPLTNKTNGGEGTSGLIFTEQHKNRLSESGKGHPCYLKVMPEYAKQKLRQKHLGKIISQEQRDKISNSLKIWNKNNKSVWLGRKHTKQSIEKMKLNSYKMFGNDNPMKNKDISKKSANANRGQPRPSMVGSKNSKSKAVLINDIKYESIRIASRELGVQSDTISRRIKRGLLGYSLI